MAVRDVVWEIAVLSVAQENYGDWRQMEKEH